MTPAPARVRGRTHARATVAPRVPRRVSGPMPRRVVAPAPALRPAPTVPRRGTTSVFGRVRALPEHRVVDRLLRSRLWIWALGALLGGIVAMQVSLLKLNSGISRAVTTTTTLERQNAGLEAAIARLSATDRIEAGAASLGMVMPPAGDVRYVSPGSGDAARAVRRMQPPSPEAAALLANGGIVPGSLAGAPVAGAQAATPAIAGTTEPTAAAPAPTGTTAEAPAPTAAPAEPGATAPAEPSATAPSESPPTAPAGTSVTTSATGGVVAADG